MRLRWIAAKLCKRLFQPPALNGCRIDQTAKVCPGSELTKVELGRYSYIGSRCFCVAAKIGSFCSVADNCRIGGAMHELSYVSTSPVFTRGKNVLRKNLADLDAAQTPQTILEHDVWLGAGCQIKSGVTVHTGAVIGMGSIVTHDVPPYEIWGGNPARKLRDRFDEQTKQRLLASQWWTRSDSELQALAGKFDDPNEFCRMLE